MSRAHAVLLLAALCPACERLNPAWCDRPGRCPAGTTCDPSTNTCLPGRDLALADRPSGPDGGAHDQRQDRRRDATPSCVGGWTCIGSGLTTGVGLCREAGGSKLRNCPGGQCAAGHCLTPTNPKICTKHQDCPILQLQVCTFLLDPGGVPREVCAPSVASFDGPVACSSGLDCATGLCTSQNQCYHACDEPGDCPSGQCVDVSLTVEGVPKTAKSCLP